MRSGHINIIAALGGFGLMGGAPMAGLSPIAQPKGWQIAPRSSPGTRQRKRRQMQRRNNGGRS